ncbi:hypothetical protein F2Q69_00043855 [Brassica cretica]|uniref:CASP-like protein n=2 Tax=Brassica TaxID=3705 RepID=A0A8S9NJT1_BRACR|nr:hypothetical protein F2Q69_00043855 [Brassica cretica]
MEKSDDHHKTSNGVSGGTATEKWEDGSTGIRTAEPMLRLAPVGLCLAALVIMLKDSQDNEFGSISYSNLSAFRIKLKLPSTVCLPSLKTLHLRLTLLNNESTHKILSNCPLLYDVRLEHDVMSKLHIAMPSLQRLTIVIESIFGPSSNLLDCYFRRLEKISTPSLKYLNIQDFASILYVRFRIKSPSNFEDTSIYRQTVQLELSMYSDVFEELLIYLLKSMNLFVLKINNKFTPRVCWKPPSSVPTCLLSSLQTLEWREYTGTCAEKEVLSYLLKHALCLKTAKIINESCGLFKKMKDLLSMPRGSTTCRLVLKQ